MKAKIINYIKEGLINGLLNSVLLRRFKNSPSPAWTVWLSDLVIVAIATLITMAMHGNSTDEMSGFIFSRPAKLLIVIAVYSLTSIVYRSYRYIVRLSAMSDVARTLKLVFTASAIMIVWSFISEMTTGVRYFSYWNVVIIGVLAFALMIVLRLLIKYLYSALSSRGFNRKNIVVLGSSINSVLLATGLRDEINGLYEPVALMSLKREDRTSANGFPIVPFNKDTLAETFKKLNADTVLFTSAHFEALRGQLADCFLSAGIKLLMFKSVEEYNDKLGDSAATENISAHVSDIKIEDLLGRDTIHTNNPHIKEVFSHQVVMVTGAAGSIGSEIVGQLADLGCHELVLIDQAETPMHELQLHMQEHHAGVKIHLFIGDIANNERMEQAFRRFHPRYVFHAAAYKHVPMMEHNPSEAVGTNVLGTKNMADLAVKYGVEKFVMISTDKAVNPTNIMGASKRIAEIYVQSLFFHERKTVDGPITQFITTRFGNVLGSNGSVIPLFKRQIEEGGPVTVTHRDIIRYFMTIPEACSLVLEAACMGKGGEIYIFDMGKPVKIYDMARKMISLAGLRPDVDIKIVETGLRPGEKLYEELLNDRETTIATHHPKIMIAKVIVYDYDHVASQISVLEADVHNADIHGIVAQMKHIVPEYHSNNSEWEAIDKELQASNN